MACGTLAFARFGRALGCASVLAETSISTMAASVHDVRGFMKPRLHAVTTDAIEAADLDARGPA